MVGYINTVRKGKTPEVSDQTENPSGEHMAELAAHGTTSKRQREKETETWGEGTGG